MDTHITVDDATAIESITGVPVSELKKMLLNAPNVTVDRFLSADRWVHSELNQQGLHLLRCTLAERVVDARRKDAGVTSHEDYESFRENGYLIKDFSKLNNTALQSLLQMVSGYILADLPKLDWTLRSVTSQAADANSDLHVSARAICRSL